MHDRDERILMADIWAVGLNHHAQMQLCAAPSSAAIGGDHKFMGRGVSNFRRRG
jgi:hypothetical protein